MNLNHSPYPIPSRENHFDFLVRCYFGRDEQADPLQLCVHRAYRDFNRTLRYFAKYKGADALRMNARQCVIRLLKELPKKKIDTQRKFDNWHETACVKLKAVYCDSGFRRFTIGHAQKWFNMSMKYIFTLGISEYSSLYQFAHIPIDNVFLKHAATHGVPPLPIQPWSHLDDYSDYLKFQQDCRDAFCGSSPLAVEFWLWLRAGDDRSEGI